MIGNDPNKDEVMLRQRLPTTSYLIIEKADMTHSGKYTCAPSNAAPTSIMLHVLLGELNVIYINNDDGGRTGRTFICRNLHIFDNVDAIHTDILF